MASFVEKVVTDGAQLQRCLCRILESKVSVQPHDAFELGHEQGPELADWEVLVILSLRGLKQGLQRGLQRTGEAHCQ